MILCTCLHVEAQYPFSVRTTSTRVFADLRYGLGTSTIPEVDPRTLCIESFVNVIYSRGHVQSVLVTFTGIRKCVTWNDIHPSDKVSKRDTQ